MAKEFHGLQSSQDITPHIWFSQTLKNRQEIQTFHHQIQMTLQLTRLPGREIDLPQPISDLRHQLKRAKEDCKTLRSIDHFELYHLREKKQRMTDKDPYIYQFSNTPTHVALTGERINDLSFPEKNKFQRHLPFISIWVFPHHILICLFFDPEFPANP